MIEISSRVFAVFAHTIVIRGRRAWKWLRWVIGPFWRGVGLQHKRGLCGSAVNRWSTKRAPNDPKLERCSTGAIPGPLGKARSIPRTFNTRTRKDTRGVRRCMWECRIAKRTMGKMLGCIRRTRMQNEMHMMTWYDMHDMNKNAKQKTKPNHGGNIISHSRKWQELELQRWKVTSGVLQYAGNVTHRE